MLCHHLNSTTQTLGCIFYWEKINMLFQSENHYSWSKNLFFAKCGATNPPHSLTSPWPLRYSQSVSDSSAIPGILWLWTIGLWARLLYLQKQSTAGYSHLKHNFLLLPIHTLRAELKADPALLTVISIKHFPHFTAAVCSTKQCVSLLSHEQLPTALPQAPFVGKMSS